MQADIDIKQAALDSVSLDEASRAALENDDESSPHASGSDGSAGKGKSHWKSKQGGGYQEKSRSGWMQRCLDLVRSYNAGNYSRFDSLVWQFRERFWDFNKELDRWDGSNADW